MLTCSMSRHRRPRLKEAFRTGFNGDLTGNCRACDQKDQVSTLGPPSPDPPAICRKVTGTGYHLHSRTRLAGLWYLEGQLR